GSRGGCVRDVVPAGLLAAAVEGEQHDQHVVRGAKQRDGPEAERPEATQDLRLLAGQEDARRGDVLRVVQLQFLRATRCGRKGARDGVTIGWCSSLFSTAHAPPVMEGCEAAGQSLMTRRPYGE